MHAFAYLISLISSTSSFSRLFLSHGFYLPINLLFQWFPTSPVTFPFSRFSYLQSIMAEIYYEPTGCDCDGTPFLAFPQIHLIIAHQCSRKGILPSRHQCRRNQGSGACLPRPNPRYYHYLPSPYPQTKTYPPTKLRYVTNSSSQVVTDTRVRPMPSHPPVAASLSHLARIPQPLP